MSPQQHGAFAADDMAAAALALARRLAAGGALWCAVPAEPERSLQLSDELRRRLGNLVPESAVRPVVGAPTDAIRAGGRPGDCVLLVAAADEAAVVGLLPRAAAWGLLVVWAGTGPRPPAGATDLVLFDDAAAPASLDLGVFGAELGARLRIELERPLAAAAPTCGDEVCITCSDEGRLGEVVSVDPSGQALVRTPRGTETVDTSLVDEPSSGDVVLIHAGSVLSVISPAPAAAHSREAG